MKVDKWIISTVIAVFIVFGIMSYSFTPKAESASYSRISIKDNVRISGGILHIVEVDGKEYLVSTYGGIIELK